MYSFFETVPSVESLQATVESLKLEIKQLNRSLQSRNGDSQIFHDDDTVVNENHEEKADSEKFLVDFISFILQLFLNKLLFV